METVTTDTFTDRARKVFEKQRSYALELRQSGLKERINTLRKLKDWLLSHRTELQQAIYNDFKKPEVEVDLSEFYIVKAEIDHAIKHLRRWMRPKRVRTPITLFGSRSFIQYEPKGVCLIIAPWNYPFGLLVGPLVSAIAAGNTVILKPSEMTPHTSALMVKMVSEVFQQKHVALFEGGAEVSKTLLSLPFDHIFFTGSPGVGKIVMNAASKHLASVTLELGGKSPAIIDANADLQDAVEKLVFAKFLNAGQTCIAPDYLLVDRKVEEQFLQLLKEQVLKTYEERPGDMAGIVNEKHLHRLKILLEDAIDKGADVLLGGSIDEAEVRFPPTILTNVPLGSAIMEEEIFGSLLPVICYDKTGEAIDLVHSKPKPLALYVFSKKKAVVKEILAQTSSGGACVNDATIHFSHNGLPFGGVNNSGIGKAHGHFGFLAFSNEKGVLKQRVGLTPIKFFYPPYTNKVKKYVNLLLKWL